MNRFINAFISIFKKRKQTQEKVTRVIYCMRAPSNIPQRTKEECTIIYLQNRMRKKKWGREKRIRAFNAVAKYKTI